MCRGWTLFRDGGAVIGEKEPAKGAEKEANELGKLDKGSVIKARWDGLGGTEFSGPTEKEKNKSH